MKKLAERYKEYKSRHSDYLQKRRELLREPEEKLHSIIGDLGVNVLREEVEGLLKRKVNKAWRLYKKIWSGDPTIKDIDHFLALADEIMTYDDFISPDMIKVWRVTRDLIWSYKHAYKGTQDGFDQKSIV